MALHVCVCVCMCVRGWAAIPSVSVEVIAVAAARADTNLMCQLGGIARAAIGPADKQVTLTEVALPQ